MNRQIIIFIISLLVLLIQMALSPIVSFWGNYINLPLIYMVCLGTIFSLKTTLLSVVFIGVVQDSLSGCMFGAHILAALITIYFVNHIKGQVFQESRVLPFILTAIFVTFSFVFFTLLKVLSGFTIANYASLLLEGVYTVVFSTIVVFPMYYVCEKLFDKISYE